MAAPPDRDPSLFSPQRKTTRLGRSLSYISSALSTNSRSPKNMPGTLKPAKTKLTPFERFVQLGRKHTDDGVTFPPPHWSQAADGNVEPSSYAAINATTRPPAHEVAPDIPPRSGSPETILIDREDLAPTPTATLHEQDDARSAEGDSADERADTEPVPEPSYLARKIQALLATLPTASPSQPQTPVADTTSTASPEVDPSHPPRLPLPAWIADSRLVSYLTSPQVMNGSSANGRPSVWDLLDRLKSSTGISTPSSSTSADKGKGPAAQPASGGERADGDNRASVMLYAPLVPDDTSEVEVARSEVISMFSDQTTIHEHESEEEAHEEMTLRERLASMWPSEGVRIGGHRLPAEHPRETRIWVPSREKISLEIRWWGYRIYLPPPVLGVLDNKRMENTKRAALLTTALKWLLDHIPAAAVPLQMRPALPLLRRIIPYTGYLGAFVAWSWDAIRSFDKGNGVILTATWLLTFALVPGTWEDDMFPEVAPPATTGSAPTGSKHREP